MDISEFSMENSGRRKTGYICFSAGFWKFRTVRRKQVKKELEEQKEKYFPDWDVQGCCVIGQYPTERHEAGGEAESHVYAADLSSAGTGGKSLLDGGGLL